MDLSIIVPVFNDQVGLDRFALALSRCRGLTPQIELIVVDNGSAPAIRPPAVAPLGETAVVVCPKPGSYAARNAGARVARGRILAFIDADCMPSEDWVLAGLAGFANGRSHIVGGEVDFTAGPAKSTIDAYQRLRGFGQADNIQRRKFSATANLWVVRDAFEAVGPFDEQLLSGGDLDWCWRAADAGYPIAFRPVCRVVTPPRSSLSGALVQARRVAAGRRALAKKWPRRPGGDIRPPPALSTLRLLLGGQQPWLSRLRLLCVALALRAAGTFEHVRLACGGRPERR